MAATWPASLPDSFLQDSFSYSPQGNLLRTDMDSGPAKVRKLFTAISKDYSGEMVFTSTQLGTFETFFETTLGYGVLTFDFPNPFNLLTTIEVRFKINSKTTPYTVVPDGGTLDWRVTLNLEKLP